MNLREAAQQALKALESVEPWEVVDHDPFAAAITALRAALSDATCQESRQVAPVAYVTGYSKGYATVQPIDPCLLMPVGMALYRSPPTINEMETVEPVAWRTKNATPPGGYVVFQQYPSAVANLGGEIEPLYTTPRQREPLTAPQIHELDWPDGVAFEDILEFTRAIERAHGIGEEE